MKTWLKIVFICFLPVLGNGQNKLIDSVRSVLSIAGSDSVTVDQLNELCFLHRYVNIDTAIYYGNAGYNLAKKIKYLRGQSRALDVLGLAYREKGDLPKALELLFKAMQIANDNGFVGERGLCLRRIGLVHADLSNWPLAREYHQHAILDYVAANDKKSLAIAYSNVARFFDEEKKYDSSRYYIERSEQLMQYAKDLYPDYYFTLAKLEQHLGNYSQALAAYQNGLVWANLFTDYRNMCNIYGGISRLYHEKNAPDSVIKYADIAINFGKKINYRLGLYRIYDVLSSFYEKRDPEKALFYLKEFNVARESLYGNVNMRVMQNLLLSESQRQQEIQEVQKAYQNKVKMLGLLGVLLITILVSVFFYRNILSQKKSALLLQQQKDELEQSLQKLSNTQSQLIQAEKMASLGELTAGIAHEIQNPLNFVNNFAEVNTELIDELEKEVRPAGLSSAQELLNDIKSNSEKITFHGKRADAIVKSMLQHSRKSTGQKELTDINALCDEYLRLSYHGLRAKDKSFNAEFDLQLDPSLPSVNVVPQDIGRVILNLINNAFYAVNERQKSSKESGYQPRVTLKTHRDGNNAVIEVADNGMGMPQEVKEKIFQPFFTTKPTGEGTGLGLSLSYDIVKYHNGKFTVDSKERIGTKFSIELPVS